MGLARRISSLDRFAMRGRNTRKTQTTPRCGVSPIALALTLYGVSSLVSPLAARPPSGSDGDEARSTAESPEKEPVVLTVDEPVYPWGSVFQGEIVEHTFVLKNTTEHAVTIQEVKPNCGCTVARGDPRGKRLDPGDSIELTLQVDTSQLDGTVKKEATIHIEGQKQHAAILHLKGEVRRVFELEPRVLRLEVVRDGALPASNLRVVLRSTLQSPIRLKSARSRDRHVDPSVTETEPGRAFRLDLRSLVPLDAKSSRHSDELELVAVVKERELRIRYPITILLKQRIQVHPSKSFWFSRKATTVKPGAPPPTRVLTLRSHGAPGHRFRIKGVRVEKSHFNARVEQVEEGRQYRLIIEFKPPPADARKVVRDRIVIETDDPSVPTITVPGSAQL